MAHREDNHLLATHQVLTGMKMPGAFFDKIASRNDWPCYAGALDYLRCGRRFGQIGEPHDEAAALLKRQQGFRGALMVGFQLLAFDLRETFEKQTYVTRAAPR